MNKLPGHIRRPITGEQSMTYKLIQREPTPEQLRAAVEASEGPAAYKVFNSNGIETLENSAYEVLIAAWDAAPQVALDHIAQDRKMVAGLPDVDQVALDTATAIMDKLYGQKMPHAQLKAIIQEAVADAIRSAAHPPAGQAQEQPAQAQEVRKAFICTNCDGVYADSHVTKCDCMPKEQTWIEGQIIYAAHPSQSTAAPMTEKACSIGSIHAAGRMLYAAAHELVAACMIADEKEELGTDVDGALLDRVAKCMADFEDAERSAWVTDPSQKAQSTAAQEAKDAIACLQSIKDWDVNTAVERGVVLALPQEIRSKMQSILDADLSTAQAKEPKP